MRAERLRCPGCDWQPDPSRSHIPMKIRIGAGARPRIVICDRRAVPERALGNDADKIYAWSRTGWAGVIHTCIASIETIQVNREYATARRSGWPRAAAVVAACLMVVAIAVWLIIALPLAVVIAIVAVCVAVGFTFADLLDTDPASTTGVGVWRSDRRNRYR